MFEEYQPHIDHVVLGVVELESESDVRILQVTNPYVYPNSFSVITQSHEIKEGDIVGLQSLPAVEIKTGLQKINLLATFLRRPE
ncbi:hypothetical protein COW81_01360 [Candidatus Campbellbacteria bacterium CG22_combo_CG10-13_8_21_14_all_36_13]|uniref:Uncharacterized protein n=1 Tax=Candidatus Campbellbacteria bacterium CG22_combo_CG10-13_8_21_14_all_36_13 TaxID=1974529 RepID=A0A2H0DZB6_9BACT|nr:MAG: hypothetical protein COW81_01360 [Candidatus Campbellbacteria bacterium CG22_combo_CG10-13_8_21_14_all_36_13]